MGKIIIELEHTPGNADQIAALIDDLGTIATKTGGSMTIRNQLRAGPDLRADIDAALAMAESLKYERGERTTLADAVVEELERLDRHVGPGVVPGRTVCFYGYGDPEEADEVTFIIKVVEADRVGLVRVAHNDLKDHYVPQVDEGWCLRSMVEAQIEQTDQRREIERIAAEAERWEGVYGAEGEAARRQLVKDVEALDQRVGPGVQAGRMVRFLAEQEPSEAEHVYLIAGMMQGYASRPDQVKLIFIPQEETMPAPTEFDGQGWCAQRLVEHQILMRDKQ